MNVIKAGNCYRVYNEEVQTYKNLPAGTYNVNFSQLEGFSLSPRPDLFVSEEKIYGSSPAKIEKVLKSYSLTNRNFGVILSGNKGVGKSMFVRLLGSRLVKEGFPVITVTFSVDGIADFLASIQQDCVVIFDEFEKTFHEKNNEQDELLSLFDGMDGGHKLFIVTCNDLGKVSEFMLNRPGRFHYHINIGSPTSKEVQEYMADNILPEYHEVIPDVVNVAKLGNMPYDYLRAIAFEINQGYSLKEALGDLNITYDASRFDIAVNLSNGITYHAFDVNIDPSDRDCDGCRVRTYDDKMSCPKTFYLSFYPSDIEMINGTLVIRKRLPDLPFDEDDFSGSDEERARIAKEWEDVKITEILLKKSYSSGVIRYQI